MRELHIGEKRFGREVFTRRDTACNYNKAFSEAKAEEYRKKGFKVRIDKVRTSGRGRPILYNLYTKDGSKK